MTRHSHSLLPRFLPRAALSSSEGKMDEGLPRAALFEGFKGRTKICPLRPSMEGVGIYLQSIFIIYLRVSSDLLLPDLCPMGRANSRAIAHGYRLPRSIKSVSKIPDFSSLLRKHSPFLLVRKKFPTSSTCMEIFEYKFSSFRRGVKFDLVVTWSRGRDNYVVKKMTIITRNRSNYVETSSPLSFLTNFIKSLHKNKFKVESKFAVVFV